MHKVKKRGKVRGRGEGGNNNNNNTFILYGAFQGTQGRLTCIEQGKTQLKQL